jgi:hypothetical protein
MSNRLLVVPMHADEVHSIGRIGRSRSHEVIPNDRIRSGDLPYIFAGNLGLCGWGHIVGVVPTRDAEGEGQHSMRITVTVVVTKNPIRAAREAQSVNVLGAS